jgi:hypothetical protein
MDVSTPRTAGTQTTRLFVVSEASRLENNVNPKIHYSPLIANKTPITLAPSTVRPTIPISNKKIVLSNFLVSSLKRASFGCNILKINKIIVNKLKDKGFCLEI